MSSPQKITPNHAIAGRWLRYWFTPERPEGLAIARILFFGLIFLFYLPQDFSLWGDVTRAIWSPTWLFMAFPLPVLDENLLNLVQIVWKVALLLSCIGLATRASTVVVFGLGLYLLGLPHNFGKVYHNDALLIFVFGILMVARSGDIWSIDWWLRGRPTVAASGEYRWPIRAVWLMMALIFFASGYAKLRDSGLAWIVSENMSVLLLKQQYGHGALVTWGAWIARTPWLYRALAAATIVIETGYPLALFSRRARWFFVPAMFLTQVGIRVIMGPSFEQFLICNLFWVPWSYLLQRQRVAAGRRRTDPESSTPIAMQS